MNEVAETQKEKQTEQLVTIDVSPDGIADVRLNRPEKYNALSQEMFTAVVKAGEDLATRTDVRVVVLSGNGPGFCAGLDMGNFAKMNSSSDYKPSESLVSKRDDDELPGNRAQLPGLVWKRLPVPVIAAIHGVAFGGGCQIALGADIRVIAPEAKMSVMEIKWGLIPDMSLTQTLRDLVPLDVAKELTFTGRILSGTKAKEIGLATRIAEDPLAVAMELAGEIAGKSPDAIRAGKELFEQTWHADERTGLELEEKLQLGLIGSANQKEAIMANFEKRAPQFADPKTKTS